MTRAHLLIASQSDELAERWLDGRLRDQFEVIELIRDSAQDPESGRRMHDTLLAKWEYLNEHSHSDMESVMWRTETVDPNTFLNDEKHAPQDVFVDNPISDGVETPISQNSGLLNFVEYLLTEEKKQAFSEVVGGRRRAIVLGVLRSVRAPEPHDRWLQPPHLSERLERISGRSRSWSNLLRRRWCVRHERLGHTTDQSQLLHSANAASCRAQPVVRSTGEQSRGGGIPERRQVGDE